MYPYCYPNYFNPTKANAAAMANAVKMPTASQTTTLQQPAPAAPTAPAASAVPGTTSGMPTESVAPAPPTIHDMVDFVQEPGPPVLTNIEYTQAYLKSQIGKTVRVEFLIGTNLLTDRTGVLVGVGISYILLQIQETDDIMLCDIYSIKFVTFLL